MEGPSLTSQIPFGSFELDLESGELLKNGRRIRLQAQPFQVLRLLLEKPGRLVTREELQRQLWPKDTFVDFEHGLNAAINRLRQVLDDSADTPRYIETLPRRGYRFIYPIDQPLPNGIQSRSSPSPSWIARAWSLISHNPALLSPAKRETATPDEIEVSEAQVSPGGNPPEVLQSENIREEERERPAEVHVEKSLKRDTESGQAATMKAAAGAPRQPVWKLLLERRRALALGSAIIALLLVSALIWKWIPGFQSKSHAPATPSLFAGERPSIVVLPFDDISPGHDNEYLADGLTEEIIGKLSQVRALKVISRTSAMTFKGTRKPMRTIAEEVKVRYVLEGSVRRAGNSLRISAQLIDAASDTHLWADQYPGTLDDVFDMQEKVSRAIVEGLKLKLTPAEEGQVARRPITNVQAYDAYLRARNVIMRFTMGKELDEALQFLQNSLKLNGDNALIYAGLGYVYLNYADQGLQGEEAFKKAEAYAEQALRLNPETAQAHVVLGLVAGGFRGDPRQAVVHFKQALSLDPNDWDATFWLFAYYCYTGNASAARSLADKLAEIDPLNPWTLIARGAVHYFCEGRFDLAADLFGRSLALQDVSSTRYYLALSLADAGRTKDALAVLEPIGPSSRIDVLMQFSRFLKLALRGEKEKMPELLSAGFRATARRDLLYSYYLASIYAMVDQREQALDWLENAVNRGFINYPYLSAYDPFLAKLRGDPRFQKLMVRVKGEWERFEI